MDKIKSGRKRIRKTGKQEKIGDSNAVGVSVKRRDVNVAAKFFPTSLAVPLFFPRSCFPNSNLWSLFS